MSINNEKHTKYLLLPGVCAICAAAVLFLLVFAPRPEFLEREKRYAAPFPDLSVRSVFDGAFESGFESWIADKMPAREVLVGLYSYLRLTFGLQNASEIIRDDDGRLFEEPFEIDKVRLDRNLEKILSLEALKNRNAVLLIAPDAGIFEKDRIADYIAQAYPDEYVYSRVTQKIDELGLNNVKFIDVRPGFAESEHFAYFATDHHWNETGSRIVYRRVCQFFGFKPLGDGNFSFNKIEEFYGSNYSRSGLWLTPPDKIVFFEPNVETRVSFSDVKEISESTIFPSHFKEADKYAAFLDGNHPVTFIENLSSDNSRVLLMIKDSYANSLAPLLIPHYSNIVVADPRYYRGSVSELASRFGADDILFVYSVKNITGDKNILLLR